MEALSSKTAIAGRIAKAVKKKVPTALAAKMAKKGRLKSGDLAEAVDDRDALAVREVRRAAHFLGLGLGGLVNVLGPQVVIVGGGVAQALGDPWLDLVRASARRQILADPDGKIQIVRAALGDDAAILGAALFAREDLLKS
jgi:glucokinase